MKNMHPIVYGLLARLRIFRNDLEAERAEKCACPSAIGQLAPVYSPHWQQTRWAPIDIVLDRWRNAGAWGKRFESLRATLFGENFIGGTTWPAGEPRPRTCSYCGSVHPDDLVVLLKRGWSLERAGSKPKYYVHPPAGKGYAVPTVKLYTPHVSLRQADAIDAALEARIGAGAVS